MKSYVAIGIAVLLLAFHARANGNVYYVNAANPNPVSPYTSWATAATNIQDATALAFAGDTVLVTNGVYQYGTVLYDGSNRVYVADFATVQSVNGPAVTTIVGYQMPGRTNGVNAVRCVYLSEFASLSGFTLTNGATAIGEYGGGVLAVTGSTISNCVIVGNTDWGGAGGVHGSSYPILVNCVISNNFAQNASGIEYCIAYNCLFTGNSGGSATTFSTLYNCTVAGNMSSGLAAAQGCKLYNSIVYNNNNGSYADCYQCNITNSCTSLGNGVISPLPSGSISNSPGFVSTSAGDYHLNPWSRCIGAGNIAYVSNNIDLDGNPRVVSGSVDMGCYENLSPLPGTFHYVSLMSTNPVPPYTNWLTAATNLQSAVAVAQPGEFVLAADGAYTNNGGMAVYGSETNCVALTNAITLLSAGGPYAAMIVGGVQTRCAYVGPGAILMGFTLTNGQGRNGGDVTNEQAGGGVWCDSAGVVSNCYIVGNKVNTSVGRGGGIFGGTVYNTIITNNNYGYGAAALTTLYNCTVSSNGWASGSQFAGGLYYSTASNCVISANRAYSGGAGVYHSVVYNSTITANQAIGGPGGGAYQSWLYGCIISNDVTAAEGTVFQCFLTNCIVSSNKMTGAYQCTNYNSTFSGNSGSDGGGVNGGISYRCVLAGNYSFGGGGGQNGSLFDCLIIGNYGTQGGGTYNSTLYNCTVIGNTATNSGGGVYSGGSVNNSILYYNFAPTGSNYSGVKFNNSCTTPTTFGVIVSNPPVFVNLAGGDYHQQTNSPTINSGANQSTIVFGVAGPPLTNGFDFDGNPRIVGGTVDIGAYEYQGSNYGLPIPTAWLIQYGLPTDGSATYLDSDGTGMNNWQKWIAGLNPTNPASVLAMASPAPSNNIAGITVTWQSVTNRTYFVQSSTNLLGGFITLQSGIAGQPGTTSYLDTRSTNAGPYYYRVGVQ